ncbi:hypothetical protein [Mesorhizobium sp. A556]
MDKIKRPRHEGNYPDRNLDCEEAMGAAIRELVDLADNAGWKTPEVLAAIGSAIVHQRIAYSEDPDPTDDPP